MSWGRRLNSNSGCSVFSGVSSSTAAVGAGSANVATETRSPKFCFINSVILDFRSSGEGNGGGGFSAMREETSCQGGFVATIRLKSDSQAQDSFILDLCRIPTFILTLTPLLKNMNMSRNHLINGRDGPLGSHVSFGAPGGRALPNRLSSFIRWVSRSKNKRRSALLP